MVKLRTLDDRDFYLHNGELWAIVYKETAGIYVKRVALSDGRYDISAVEEYTYGDEMVSRVDFIERR